MALDQATRDRLVARLSWLEELAGTRAAVITDKDKQIAELKAELKQEKASVKQLVGDVRAMQKDFSNAKKALEVGKQAMSEIHAARSKPGWFTNGESAAWRHTTMWIDRFMEAARAALEG